MLHTPLGTFPETWKKLWIAFKTQNEVALQYMSGIFNGSMVVERYNHSIVAREDGFGLCSIDNLDPDLVINQADPYYWHEMILYLISIGYVPGETLFGFPYDWRQSVRHPPTLARLHTLIHTIRNNTQGAPLVDIMTHSMGGLIAKAYVARYLEDAIGVLGKWTAIGTPWKGGGSVAYKAMISGYALDMTTIPIIDWGLRENIAHAVELNWPSAFELMPDIDHDPWWRSKNLASPPRISYQILGQNPTVAEAATEVKALLQSVNSGNVQVFAPGTPAVANPLSMEAWQHADRTRNDFASLTERLALLRDKNPTTTTLEITSIEGSQVDTKYSLSFPRAVRSTAELQTVTPTYAQVGGDGTVPYASSLSDGLDAKHLEYKGVADHQRLLRTPEIFLGVRHSLRQTCLLEGDWKTDIYSPSGEIFSTQYWHFGDEKAMLVEDKVLTKTNDFFNTTLPDGTAISGTLDRACTSFVGNWFFTYRTVGTRIIGTHCRDPSSVKVTPVPNGQRKNSCIYGNWSNATTLYCDDKYEPIGDACQLKIVPQEPSQSPEQADHTTRTVIIVVCCVAAVILIGVVAFLLITRLCGKKNDGGYKLLTINDSVLSEDQLV